MEEYYRVKTLYYQQKIQSEGRTQKSKLFWKLTKTLVTLALVAWVGNVYLSPMILSRTVSPPPPATPSQEPVTDDTTPTSWLNYLDPILNQGKRAYASIKDGVPGYVNAALTSSHTLVLYLYAGLVIASLIALRLLHIPVELIGIGSALIFTHLHRQGFYLLLGTLGVEITTLYTLMPYATQKVDELTAAVYVIALITGWSIGSVS